MQGNIFNHDVSISGLAIPNFHPAELLKLKNLLNITGVEIVFSKILNLTDRLTAISDFHDINLMLRDVGLRITSTQSTLFGIDSQIYGTKGDLSKIFTRLNLIADLCEMCNCHHMVFANPKNRLRTGRYSTFKELEFFDDLASWARCRGIVIGLEANPPCYGTDTLNTNAEVVQLLNEINNSALRWNCDLASLVHDGLGLDYVYENREIISNFHISELFLPVYSVKTYEYFCKDLRKFYFGNITYEYLLK